MVAAFLIHLSILKCSSESYHEFLHYSIKSIRVITIWVIAIISIFFFQLCQMYSRFLGRRLITLKFPLGKEAGSPRFRQAVSSWEPRTLRQFYGIFFLSLPGGPKVIRIRSHLQSCLQVGYHHFQSFQKSTIEMIPLQFHYTVWRKAVWERGC